MDVPPVEVTPPQQPPLRLKVDFEKLVARMVKKAYRVDENGDIRAEEQSKTNIDPTTK